MKPVTVYVVDYGRSNLYMRYTDPETGKSVTRSTGEKARKKAEKVAAKWEDAINEGRYIHTSRTDWEVFRHRYENEVLPGLKKTSQTKAMTVIASFSDFAGPSSLGGVTPEILSRFVSHLRAAEKSESTIKGYLATLRAAFQWGIDMQLAPKMPRFPKVQRAKNITSGTPLRGRPLTDAEFEKMLKACPDDRWRFYLRGLWLSGLRLRESLDLWWDRTDRLHVVMGDRPLMSIAADSEKGNRDRLLPITPDFAEFLKAIPDSERFGRVFKLYEDPHAAPTHWTVSSKISEIGKKSGVMVNGRQKHASAHDLRRSFGERWAIRVMPHLLMQLMRHSSMETTLRFYVGRNALVVADELYKNFSNSGNTPDNTQPKKPAKKRRKNNRKKDL